MAGNQIDEVTALKSELAKTRCLLFVAVRNTTVLPNGLLFGWSEREICKVTLGTIDKLEKTVDLEKTKKLIKLGEEAQSNGNAGKGN